MSLGGAGPLDVAGILEALDRYPYGCAEQITSRAMPLVYLDDVAVSIGLAADDEIKKRVQAAIAGVLADQAASGSFGLWGPEDAGNDLWLDSYVTDFITRAADKGYSVPALAKRIALDNLSNRVAYAADFSSGGQDIAYALYVLARNGRAAIGDLRYYTDSKLTAFSTPLAKAQIGAAMALYGDKQRAATAFAAATAALDAADADKHFRSDYGSNLRDDAGVLTLAAETNTGSVDVRALATRIATASQARKLHEHAGECLDAAGRSGADQGLRRRRSSRSTAPRSPVRCSKTSPTRRSSPPRSTSPTSAPTRSTRWSPPPACRSSRIPPAATASRSTRAVYDTDGNAGEPQDGGAERPRFVVVLTVTAEAASGGHMMVVDPIPAGFEIENPDLSVNTDASTYSWLTTDTATHTEARTDRFMATLDRETGDSLQYSVAYTMRAVSPGVFTAPAALVQDMYRPELNAQTATGKVEIVRRSRGPMDGSASSRGHHNRLLGRILPRRAGGTTLGGSSAVPPPSCGRGRWPPSSARRW